jgi:glycosyltransferase involved in cell wall biosynthesis
MKAPISVCMIVRDEADTLQACLESVAPICEDVVVVDTGSRDGTPELAKRQGARVFEFPWIDDFSAARNFAADQAQQPFILRLDADERLLEGSLPALQTYCGTRPAKVGRAARANLLPTGETVREYLTCLYPNVPADYRYMGRIHEQLCFRGKAPRVIQTDLVILHIGYAPEFIQSRNKTERNLRLLEMDLADSPTDPYLHFQIGQTLYVMKDYASAVASFEAALRLLEAQDAAVAEVAYLPTIYQQEAYAFVYLGDLDSALRTISAGIDLFPDYTDLYFVYGIALLELGGPSRMEEMVSAFASCLSLGEPDAARYTTVAGVGSFRAQHNLGAFREAMGDVDGARTLYREAASAGFKPSIERLQHLA